MYTFHDTNTNSQTVPMYNIYSYIKNANPFLYFYLLRHEQECSDDMKVCDIEVPSSIKSSKFQFSLDYNVIANNNEIASRVSDGNVSGDCGIFIIVNKVTNSISYSTDCGNTDSLNVNNILNFVNMNIGCNCDVDFMSLSIDGKENVRISKTMKRMKMDSGLYTYNYQTTLILPQSKIFKYESDFVDNASINCNFSYSDQSTISVNVHKVGFEVIYNDEDDVIGIDLPKC